MWGRSRQDIVGKTIREIAGDDTQAALHDYTRRALAGETVSYEAPFTSGGETRMFLNTYTPVTSVDGRIRGFIATGVDITERIEAERQMRATVDSLREERALREQFVATLSHDLRTPLSAAKMGAELLLRGGDPERVKLLPSRIAQNLDRVDAMLRDLLDANSLKAGERLPIEISACALDDIARETLDDLSSVHGDRFVLRTRARIEGYWSCDGIRRILENLCTNAIKYGAPQAPVTVSLDVIANQVAIRVHNFGPPIAADEQERLFEPFRRSPSARGQNGWGLGLPLVRGIADAHGGHVTLASSEDAGTTFTVTLPVDARATSS
jgi:signal transduction histidine kinase